MSETDEDRWAAVDDYIVDRLFPPDDVLQLVQADSAAARLPAHEVSAPQGKFLHLLARMIGARRILEIGTLGGYSTIWLARGLAPGGRLVSLEIDPRLADLARQNIAMAGLSDRVEVRTGAALNSLPTIEGEGFGPFDLIFIDADKPNNPAYLDWALKLSRAGTVIVADNVVRGGAVMDADSDDERVGGVRAFFDLLASEPRLDATVLQTVGWKGWDGFALALVR